MKDKLIAELKGRFDSSVYRIIERHHRMQLRGGRINGEKVSPAIYAAARRRLLDLAGLSDRHSAVPRRGEILLKVGRRERVLKVVRHKGGNVTVETALAVVKRAQRTVRSVIKACCGGHCSRGAYHITPLPPVCRREFY
jgi:hypothetical protein